MEVRVQLLEVEVTAVSVLKDFKETTAKWVSFLRKGTSLPFKKLLFYPPAPDPCGSYWIDRGGAPISKGRGLWPKMRKKNLEWCHHFSDRSNTPPLLKELPASFVYFEKTGLTFSKSLFPIQFNLLHPLPSAFLFVLKSPLWYFFLFLKQIIIFSFPNT